MQSAVKELRILKQEESAMVNLASKISDQLNRLKVEELALQNMVHLQNEEQERRSRGSLRSINCSIHSEDSQGGNLEEENDKEIRVIPIDLVVNKHHIHTEEEEEEEEDDDNDLWKENKPDEMVHDDIEQFVQNMC